MVIANPLTGATATTAYNLRTGAKITDPAGGPQVALTYFNAGKATIRGIDAGLKLYFTDKVSLSVNASFSHDRHDHPRESRIRSKRPPSTVPRCE